MVSGVLWGGVIRKGPSLNTEREQGGVNSERPKNSLGVGPTQVVFHRNYCFELFCIALRKYRTRPPGESCWANFSDLPAHVQSLPAIRATCRNSCFALTSFAKSLDHRTFPRTPQTHPQTHLQTWPISVFPMCLGAGRLEGLRGFHLP